jgi:hypothetical protein
MRLLKQRRRWTSGFLRNVLFDYRDLIGSNRNHALGFFVLPLALLSVMSGSLLFIAAIFSTIYRVSDAITIRAGVPVSYAYLPHYSHLDWFYAPTTPFTFLGLIALGVALSFILLGSRVSNIQGPIKQGMLAYVFLYGITAPLWLLSAAFDVALGKKRSWR